MKKLLIFAFALLLSSSLYAQNRVVDGFYQRFSNDDDATTIDLSGSLLNFLSNMVSDDDGDDFKKATKGVTHIKVVSIAKERIRATEVDRLKKAFDSDRFEEYAVIQEGKKKNYVLAKGGEVIKEVVVLAFGDEKFSLIYFEGEIDPKTIGEILDGDEININFSNNDDDND